MGLCSSSTAAADTPRRPGAAAGKKERDKGRGIVACGKRTDFGYDKDFEARYSLGKLLGHGQFGYTFAAVDRASGDRVAVKRIDKNKVPCSARRPSFLPPSLFFFLGPFLLRRSRGGRAGEGRAVWLADGWARPGDLLGPRRDSWASLAVELARWRFPFTTWIGEVRIGKPNAGICGGTCDACPKVASTSCQMPIVRGDRTWRISRNRIPE